MRARIVAVTLIFCSSAFASGQASHEPKSASLCEITSAPREYANAQVATEVVLQPSYHSLAAYDPACMPTEANNITTQAVLPPSWDSSASGKKLRVLLSHHRAARVTVIGTFDGSEQPHGPDAARFRLVIEHVISVESAAK